MNEAVSKILHERDEAQIRLYGALWKLVVDEVISESKARELSGMSIEECRRVERKMRE